MFRLNLKIGNTTISRKLQETISSKFSPTRKKLDYCIISSSAAAVRAHRTVHRAVVCRVECASINKSTPN